jgi:hypothetical protein
MPECDVRVGIARDVEAVGIGEMARIAIRGADHGEHERAGRDRTAT